MFRMKLGIMSDKKFSGAGGEIAWVGREPVAGWCSLGTERCLDRRRSARYSAYSRLQKRRDLNLMRFIAGNGRQKFMKGLAKFLKSCRNKVIGKKI